MASEPAHPTAREQLWTARDVAAYLQVSISWVYRAAEQGTLPSRRIGAMLRFVPTDVMNYVQTR